MPIDLFIPYWGDPDYMKDTVQSILTQDSDEWKLTIVDDAYPDKAVETFITALDHPRIQYIRKPKNEGITANFRSCVGLASQDLIAIIGCDDLLLPNYVSTVLSAHREYPQASIIQPGVRVIDENGNVSRTLTDTVKQRILRPGGSERRIVSGERLASSLMTGVWLYWPSLAFRTEKLRDVDFRDGFPIIQDVALEMDMILAGAELLIEPTVCFAYRRHSKSASASKLIDGSRFTGEREYFDLAANLAQEQGWNRAARFAKLRLTSRAHAFSLLPKALTNKNYSAVKQLFRHVFGS